jgi:hypothetical protein
MSSGNYEGRRLNDETNLTRAPCPQGRRQFHEPGILAAALATDD